MITEFLDVSIVLVRNLLASNKFIPSTDVRSEFVRTKSGGKTISMMQPVLRGRAESNSSLKEAFSWTSVVSREKKMPFAMDAGVEILREAVPVSMRPPRES